jgi:hypothetical protein
MKRAIEWLKEPWTGDLPFSQHWGGTILGEDAPSRLQVFAALINMNGGLAGLRYGVITMGGTGVYRRHGLSREEAEALIFVNTFVSGMLEAYPDETFQSELGTLLDAEWTRIEEARAAAAEELAAVLSACTEPAPPDVESK